MLGAEFGAEADEGPATEAVVDSVEALEGTTALPSTLSRLDGCVAGASAVLDCSATGEGERALPWVWDGPASSGFDSDFDSTTAPSSPACLAFFFWFISHASFCTKSGSQYRG